MADNAVFPVGLSFAIIIVLLAAGVGWSVMRAMRSRREAREKREERGGSVEFVIDTFHDLVSQLKTKEEELNRLKAVAEDRADSIQSTSEDILRSVPGGVVTLNEDSAVLFINPAAREILGLAGEGEGKVTSLDDLGPEIATAVGKARRGELEDPSRMEVAYRHATRGRLLLGMRVSDLRNHLDETVGVVIVFNDLTDVRRLEERVRLREKLTHLGEMSAGIAHELRNPMGVIRGYADLLVRETPEDDPRHRSVIAIRDEIKGMNRVITEFLDFARPTPAPNRGTVNLRNLLDGVRDACCPRRPEVRVELDVPPELTVSADELLLRQALLNLVNNALEAIPEGAGTVGLAAGERAGAVRIEVRDTGPGLKAGDVEKIFLPFHTTKASGTGLGLAIVHKIVTCHGGTIEVRNGDTGGAVFTVELPGEASVA